MKTPHFCIFHVPRSPGTSIKYLSSRNFILIQHNLFNIQKLERKNDHSILNAALTLKQKEKKRQVILVSKDINLRLKAKSLDLQAEDYETGKIKNAPKGYPQAPNGWWLSEKYDGYRALWDGQNFYSRGNHIFNVPKWFKAFMPPSIALDGELFLGRECFEKCGIFSYPPPLVNGPNFKKITPALGSGQHSQFSACLETPCRHAENCKHYSDH